MKISTTKVESLNGEVLGNNFVIQELLKQHSDIARFNPTSINSCRVTSIFLEGVFSFSCTFKTGKQGSRIDNWNSSYFVGVNSDGTLHDYGFDSKLNPFKQTDTGIVFGGNTLPKYDVMIERISFWHQHYFPQVGIIGWDVFIDDNEQIKVIEVNLSSPGIVVSIQPLFRWSEI